MLPLLGPLIQGIGAIGAGVGSAIGSTAGAIGSGVGSLFGGGAAASSAAGATAGSAIPALTADFGAGAMLAGGAGPTVANASALGLGSASSAGLLSQVGQWATSPMIGSQAWSSPLMLGTTGMTLASGLMNTGQSFQDNIRLTKEGEKLKSDYSETARQYFNLAKSGKNKDAMFSAVSADKQAEGTRYRSSMQNRLSREAARDNTGFNQRGSAVKGGSDVVRGLQEAGQRVSGLTQPTNTKQNSQREEFINAFKQISNLNNLDNQSAAVAYSSSLAKYNADIMRNSNKGAAIGSAVQGMGTANMMTNYYNSMRNA